MTDYDQRDELIKEMQRRELFPGFYKKFYPEEYIQDASTDAGLYPSVEDPNFVRRLLQKTEFADTVSPPMEDDPNGGSTGPDFEVTPVQRFVANFMHPKTPYKSALLYHGVGVGKTCTAVQCAEAFLDIYPRQKVILVAPPTIQGGFQRTIFDSNQITIGTGDAPNRANQCTGDTYLRLAGVLFERDRKVIETKVKKAVKMRYELMGYRRLGNIIKGILESVPPVKDPRLTDKEREKQTFQRRAMALQKVFNTRLLIIDEAHNLRDTGAGPIKIVEAEKAADEVEADVEEEDTPEEDKSEAKDAKFLTPYLLEVLKVVEGTKLLLMTATPMFNDVREIAFILSLLLLNDKKRELSWPMILKSDKELAKDGTRQILKPKAEEYLQPVANAYVSFMRGENPNNFPIRLYPELDHDDEPYPRLTKDNYPDLPLALTISDEDKEGMARLPFVVSELVEGTPICDTLWDLTNEKVRSTEKGIGYQTIDSLLQAGNCVFPSGSVGRAGFESAFEVKSRGQVQAVGDEGSDWLLAGELANYAPKIDTIVKSVAGATGVCFSYSRFVATGAWLTALALEANGFTPYGRDYKLLQNLPKGFASLGRQCALCSSREKKHDDSDHKFTPAKYILLTGDSSLSPRNEEMIRMARSEANKDGSIIKVVLGSQIAGEGLDLRFVREVHILDAWFHLNKTEQIIGRGIRFNSHTLLPPTMRNCTVFLHVIQFPETLGRESADLYCYRRALQKAIYVGQVSRILKINAMDCNLRKHVTVFHKPKGDIAGTFNPRNYIDSQGQPRDKVDVNDTDFTVICDWMECDYTCKPDLTIDVAVSDDSTYDTFESKVRETKIQKLIQEFFSKQPFAQAEVLLAELQRASGAPPVAIDMVLQTITNNRLFRIRSGGRDGYLIFKNKYFLFQPDVYRDITIPMALRIADYPIKQDEYTFEEYKEPELQPVSEAPAKPADIAPQLEFWTRIETWVEGVGNGTETKPTTLQRAIEVYTQDFKQSQEAYEQRLNVLLLFARQFGTPERRATVKQALLEYFWDEWFTVDQQVQMLRAQPDKFRSISPEQVLVSGSSRYFRYVNAYTNSLEYSNKEGKPVSEEVREALTEEGDQVSNRLADDAHAGPLYGFMVPKRGRMVFKTQAPYRAGAVDKKGKPLKPDRGAECANVSNKTYVPKLGIIREELQKKGIDIAVLHSGALARASEITNSNTGCALLDLSLRFMDLAFGSSGIRWFFRPVASYMSQHRGIVSEETRASVAVASKAERQLEVQARKEARTEDTKVRQLKKKAEKAAERAEAAKKVLAEAEAVVVGKATTDAKPKAEATTKPKPSSKPRTLKLKTGGPKERKTRKRVA